jgi:hypothetical protein
MIHAKNQEAYHFYHSTTSYPYSTGPSVDSFGSCHIQNGMSIGTEWEELLTSFRAVRIWILCWKQRCGALCYTMLDLTTHRCVVSWSLFILVSK